MVGRMTRRALATLVLATACRNHDPVAATSSETTTEVAPLTTTTTGTTTTTTTSASTTTTGASAGDGSSSTTTTGTTSAVDSGTTTTTTSGGDTTTTTSGGDTSTTAPFEPPPPDPAGLCLEMVDPGDECMECICTHCFDLWDACMAHEGCTKIYECGAEKLCIHLNCVLGFCDHVIFWEGGYAGEAFQLWQPLGQCLVPTCQLPCPW
jgi:hypothetical protein